MFQEGRDRLEICRRWIHVGQDRSWQFATSEFNNRQDRVLAYDYFAGSPNIERVEVDVILFRAFERNPQADATGHLQVEHTDVRIELYQIIVCVAARFDETKAGFDPSDAVIAFGISDSPRHRTGRRGVESFRI